MQSSATDTTTQRRLILIRHAKAAEDQGSGDHARPLSDRGQADAEALGLWLEAEGLSPQLALCSTAARTRQTLGRITHKVPTILSDRLYLASPGEMLAQVQATDDAVSTLMMVCHNPGAHALLALLVGHYANEVDADHMMLKFPTSACAVLEFNIAHWQDISPESATLTQLRY